MDTCTQSFLPGLSIRLLTNDVNGGRLAGHCLMLSGALQTSSKYYYVFKIKIP